jgi:hypothetical protein
LYTPVIALLALTAYVHLERLNEPISEAEQKLNRLWKRGPLCIGKLWQWKLKNLGTGLGIYKVNHSKPLI